MLQDVKFKDCLKFHKIVHLLMVNSHINGLIKSLHISFPFICFVFLFLPFQCFVPDNSFLHRFYSFLVACSILIG